MQNPLSCLLIGMLVISTSSCWFFAPILNPTAHGGFRVTGTIIAVPPPRNRDDCTLQLYRKGKKESIKNVPIPGKINERFLLSPRSRKYFMTVSCSQSPVTFKSQIYKIKGAPLEPIELGIIDLTAPPSKPNADQAESDPKNDLD